MLDTEKNFVNLLPHAFLRFFALNFNWRPSLNKYLKSPDRWINFAFGMKTENGSIEQALVFEAVMASLAKFGYPPTGRPRAAFGASCQQALHPGPRIRSLTSLTSGEVMQRCRDIFIAAEIATTT
jgi:hypothetical protein